MEMDNPKVGSVTESTESTESTRALQNGFTTLISSVRGPHLIFEKVSPYLLCLPPSPEPLLHVPPPWRFMFMFMFMFAIKDTKCIHMCAPQVLVWM